MTKEMNKSLIARIRQVNEVELQIIENGGELTTELEASLEFSELQVMEKVDAYAYMIENLKERARYWDEKAALLKKYSKTCLSVVDRLKGNLKAYMMLEDRKEIAGDDVRFTLASMAPTLQYDESLIPDAFYKTEVIRTLDKELIKNAIKDGHDVPGVTKVDVFSLRTYPMGTGKKTKKELADD